MMLQALYNRTVRRVCPPAVATLNGVAVRGPVKLLDRTRAIPDYKPDLVGAVRDHVGARARVVVVGAGWGVATVAAARRAHEGHVTAYEASASMFRHAADTIRLNQVSDRVTLHHAAVGEVRPESRDRYGPPAGAGRVAPSDLPPADVYVLDCEGAEADIVPALPAGVTVIAEAHPGLGQPAEWVAGAIEAPATVRTRGDRTALVVGGGEVGTDG